MRRLVSVITLALSLGGIGCAPSGDREVVPAAERVAVAPATDPAAPAGDSTEWRVVGTWSGRGSNQLETFPIERFTWRVRWSAKNEAAPGAGRLRVTAHSGDSGRLLAEVADLQETGADVTYVTELPHRYYLVVTSSDVDWTLVAEEPVFR